MPTTEFILERLESEAESAAKRLPIQTRLCREASIVPLVSEAVRQMELYEAQLLINAVALNPQDAIEQIRRQINSTSDMERVAALQRRASEISQFSVEAQQKARGLCIGFHDEHVKPALLNLVNAALEVLDEFLAEATNSELLLFSQFALQHEPTGVSRRVQAVVATMTQFRDGFVEIAPTPQFLPPPPSHPALDWFRNA